MTAPDPGLTDLIAAHRLWFNSRDGAGCYGCGWRSDVPPSEGLENLHHAHVALEVEQHTNGREALFDTAELVAAYDRGWNAAEHWWHDGAVEGEIPPNPYIIRAALEGEQQ